MRFDLPTFAFFLLLLNSTTSRTVEYDFVVDTIQAAPDGFPREVLTANGKFPPPTFNVTKGDRLVVNVKNKLKVGFALHMHGLFFRGVPWMDGFPGVTQCPIPPGGTMRYEVDLKDQAGTTWYHSHFNSQYVDGLAGPLIIHDPKDPHLGLYDEEYVVALQDWYHESAATLADDLLQPNGTGEEPIPISGLINGRGRCGTPDPDGKCDPNSKLSDFEFVPGKRYRLRLINASAFSSFQFSIDGHKLTVIEADMTPVKPLVVDRLNINVAQRYSVIVTANRPSDIYWMKAIISKACYPEGSGPDLNPYVLATVSYKGACKTKLPPLPSVNKSTELPNNVTGCIDLDSSKLKPVEVKKPYIPNGAKDDKVLLKKNTFSFIASFSPDDQNIVRGRMNGKTLEAKPEDPFILRQNDKQFFNNSHILELPSCDVVQFLVCNNDGGEHPFHLHGYDFQVMNISTVSVEYKEGAELEAQMKQILKDAMDHMVTDNPLRRDTVSIPANGYALIRFVADNPGIWAFHCHIDWHLAQGLGLLFRSDAEKLSRLTIPSGIKDTCKAYSNCTLKHKGGFYSGYI